MSKDVKRADQDYVLADLIVVTYQALVRMQKDDLDPFDVTPEAGRVMIAIDTLGKKATSAAISRYVFRKPNSVSEILSRMQKKGLIKRERQNKGRSQIIVLTDKGRKVHESIDNLKLRNLSYLTSFMTDEEERQLMKNLEGIVLRAVKRLGIDLPSRLS